MTSVGKITAEVEVKYDGKAISKLSTDLTKVKKSISDTDKATSKASRGFSLFGKSGDTAARGLSRTALATDKLKSSFTSVKEKMSSYAKGAKSSERATEGLRRSSSRLGGTLRTGIKYLAATAAAYLGIAEARKAITATTDLAKATGMLNKGLGISIKSASQFAAVAKTRGVETTTLGMAFRTLSKNIESAKDGTESSVDAFKRLGISTKELKNQGVEETFYDIADGLGKMEAGSEKNALGGELLARGWQKLSPLIRDGSGALKENMKLAEQYGASFSGKSIKSIDDLIAAERELQLMQLGLQIQLTQAFAPALLSGARAFAKLGKEFQAGEGTGGKIKSVLESLGQIMKSIWPTVKAVGTAIGTLIEGFSKLPGPVQTIIVALTGVTYALTKFGAIGYIIARVGGWGAIFTKVGSIMKGFFLMIKAAPLMMGGFGLLIAAIAAGAYLIIKNWDWVKKTLGNIWEWIKTAATNVGNFIANAARKGFLGPIPWIISNWGKVKNFLGGVWNTIKNLFSSGVAFVVSAARKGFLGPVPWIIANWNKVKSFLTNIWERLKTAMSNTVQFINSKVRSLLSFLGKMPSAVAGYFRQLPGRIASAISKVASVIVQPFQSGVDKVKSAISSIPGILSSALSGARGVINDVIGGVNGMIRAFNKLPGPDIGEIGYLAEGGVAGPGKGGIAVVGEGRKPEWVISQEGPKDKNIGYLMQAAQALGVPLMRDGGVVNYNKPNATQVKYPFLAFWEKELAKAEAVSPDDPADDLTALHALRDIWWNRAGYLNSTAITAHDKKKPKRKNYPKGKKGTAQYNAAIKSWTDQKNQIYTDAGSAYTSWRDYKNRFDELFNTAPGEEGTAPSLSEQAGFIAGEKMQLLTSFASNIRRRTPAAAGTMMTSTAPQAAMAGTNNATGTSVNIVQNYQEPPQDPHAWTRELQNEITATL